VTKPFSEFLQEAIDKRREAKKQPYDREKVEQQHQAINAPGYINHTFGRMVSEANVPTR